VTRHFATVAFVGYALLIAWLSLSPPSDAGALFWDKALHATAYLIFVLLGSPLCRDGRHVIWLGLFVLCYSALMEVGQYYVPGRFMSGADMVANGLGVALGVALVFFALANPGRLFLR
jgi:VanZ family protein